MPGDQVAPAADGLGQDFQPDKISGQFSLIIERFPFTFLPGDSRS